MARFTHVVLTRFNLKGLGNKAAPDDDWLAHRLDLFEQYTLPSMRAQTCRHFRWLVFFDAETPEFARTRIASYEAWTNFIACYVEESYRLVRTKVVSSIVEQHIQKNDTHLISTRLDNDDAVARTFIQQIQDQFQGQTFEVLNFMNGLLLAKNRLYHKQIRSGPFASLIEAGPPFRTIWYQMHGLLGEVGEVREIDTRPAWVQVVHGRNVSNQVLPSFERVPMSQLTEQFEIQVSLTAGWMDRIHVMWNNGWVWGRRWLSVLLRTILPETVWKVIKRS